MLPSDTGPAGAAVAPSDPSRILTLPNVITFARLLCLPLFLWLLLVQHERVAAGILLAVLGATDWCDGYIARRFHQESDLGRLFDPTVDRLLFLVGVGAIVIDGAAPVWFCVLVLARELTVALITVGITLRGAHPVHVTWYGKAGTFLLMFAFPWFLGGASDLASAPIFQALAWMVGIPGLVLSYYAAFAYVPAWRASLREARTRRGVHDPDSGS